MKKSVAKKKIDVKALDKKLKLQNQKFFQLAVFSFFALTLMVTAAYMTSGNITGYQVAGETEEQAIQFTFNLFKIDPSKWTSLPEGQQGFFATGNWQLITIHAMIFLILGFSFFYIFSVFLFFGIKKKSSKLLRAVPIVAGFGLAVVVSLLGGVSNIVIWMSGIVGALAGFGVFVAMIIAVVFFIIVTILRNRLQSTKLRRKVIKGRTKIREGLKTLAAAGEETEEAGED